MQSRNLQKRTRAALRSLVPLGALLASAALASSGAAQQDVAAWDALPWGSAPAEVRQLFDGRLRDSAPGEVGDAVADEVSIGGCPAQARLSFGPDGLDRILLVARPGSNARCADLERRLRRRFGRPVSGREAPGDVTLEWSLPSTHVTYVHVHVKSPSLDWERAFVTYERRSESR